MKNLLIIILICSGVYSFGQIGFSNQTITVNGHQVEIIQSTLFMDIQPHNCPELDTFNISYNQDTFHINYYYDARVSHIGMGCIQTDTVYIDSLPIGNYTLIFHIHEIVGFIDTFNILYNQALDTAHIVITSNLNVDKASFISLYPNPVQQYLNIEVQSLEIEEIYLYNLQGQIIRFFPKDRRRLNLQHLENGIYILRIKTDVGWINKKIIKK